MSTYVICMLSRFCARNPKHLYSYTVSGRDINTIHAATATTARFIVLRFMHEKQNKQTVQNVCICSRG